MNTDLVKEVNQGEQQAEQNAETFANRVEEETSLSEGDAEKRIREIFGIPAQPDKKKDKKNDE
jgi:hypothetical protein